MIFDLLPEWLQEFEKEAGYIVDNENFFYKGYKLFLWFWGFAQGEHITDMLRRQKQRLGKAWWAGVGGIFGFLIWLVLHIIGVC